MENPRIKNWVNAVIKGDKLMSDVPTDISTIVLRELRNKGINPAIPITLKIYRFIRKIGITLSIIAIILVLIALKIFGIVIIGIIILFAIILFAY